MHTTPFMLSCCRVCYAALIHAALRPISISNQLYKTTAPSIVGRGHSLQWQERRGEGTLTLMARGERRGDTHFNGRRGEGILTSMAGEERRGDTHSNGRRGEERGHSL